MGKQLTIEVKIMRVLSRLDNGVAVTSSFIKDKIKANTHYEVHDALMSLVKNKTVFEFRDDQGKSRSKQTFMMKGKYRRG